MRTFLGTLFGILAAVFIVFVMIGSCSKSIMDARNSTNQHVVTPSLNESRNDPATPVPSSTRPEWADATQAVQQGSAQVKITNIAVDHVATKQLGQDACSQDELLAISLEITNTSPTKKMDYKGWGAKQVDFNGAERASVQDDAGNVYKRIHFGFGSRIVGQVKDDGESIYPSKSISDVVVFEPPTETCKYLLLELPASGFGGDGMLRIKIPRSMIVTAADREQKKLQAEAEAKAKHQKEEAEAEAKRREDEKQRLAAEAKERDEDAQRRATRLKQEEEAKYHTWTSADGKHTTEAKFIKGISGIIYLEKRDGTVVKVPKDQLSSDDLKWMVNHK
jgi:hypothetical protein